jgi:hypothetical protein
MLSINNHGNLLARYKCICGSSMSKGNRLRISLIKHKYFDPGKITKEEFPY